MRILVTGADGFVGKNLCASLQAIQDGYDHVHPIRIEKIWRYDRNSSREVLIEGCRNADFVFHLAGVNRPKDPAEFQKGNFGFSSELLDLLKQEHNTCPVMLSSSIQASLIGRYAGSEYGKSKLAGENLFFDYGAETGAKVLVYRFPNLFGKWCRPNYNSVIATFCYNIAHSLPIQINDRSTELELLYIDDLIEEMLGALSGEEHHCSFDGVSAVPDHDGKYCYVPGSCRATLGEIADLLEEFRRIPETKMIPCIPDGSFAKKLWSTYLSYLPEAEMIYDVKGSSDVRGSFTELLKTDDHGQVSVNITKPGVTKGMHWHHTKFEFFIVVSGHARIRERCIYSDEIRSFEVSGDHIQSVVMLPGYTHEITNLSDHDDLVTIMYANECFDPAHPDTFHEEVSL